MAEDFAAILRARKAKGDKPVTLQMLCEELQTYLTRQELHCKDHVKTANAAYQKAAALERRVAELEARG